MQAQQTYSRFWPWLGWFIASLAGLYQFLVQTSTSVMIGGLEQAFALNSFGVSLLSSSFFYTYLIFQIPAGMVIDYFRPRRTIFVCQLVLALLCLIFAKSTSVWTAGASRMLMGFFSAPSIVAALYLAARTLPERYFALVAGLTEMMGMLGGVAGESLLARSVLHFGWRHTMFILAAIAVSMAILAFSIIRDDKNNLLISPRSGDRRKNILHDLFAMLSVPQAWINGLFCGLLFSLVAAFGAFWCIPFLIQLYGIPLHSAADASSMIFVGTAFGTPMLGWLSERLDARRPLMMICTVCALVVAVTVIYLPGIPFAWVFFLLFLLGFFSGVYLLSFAVIRDITPAHMRGTAMGYINMMCILIGSPLLQPLIGYILHSHNVISVAAYQHAFLTIPISLLIALGLAFFVREE